MLSDILNAIQFFILYDETNYAIFTGTAIILTIIMNV